MSPTESLEPALLELDLLQDQGARAFESAKTADAVEAARIEYLGQKQGRLKAAQERLKTLEPAGKRAYGQRFNLVKQALEASLIRKDIPEFRNGDTVRVHYKIVEGDKERVQIFQGLVIKQHRAGARDAAGVA